MWLRRAACGGREGGGGEALVEAARNRQQLPRVEPNARWKHNCIRSFDYRLNHAVPLKVS